MPGQNKTEEIADQLHSVAIHLLRLVRVQDARSGIAPARLSALSVIVFGGPISLRDLAKAEQVRPPTMSRIVDALEAQGLAHRRVDKQDRRAVVIAATKKGVATLKQGRQRRVRFLASYLAGLNVSELELVARALRVIQGALRSQ